MVDIIKQESMGVQRFYEKLAGITILTDTKGQALKDV